MDKQITETIWMPYPECIDYLKTLDEDTEIMVSWYDESGKYIKGKLGVSKHRVWELLRTNMIGVTAISMLPAAYDPEAKTVNFATACLWMQEMPLVIFVSDVTNEDYWFNSTDKQIHHYNLHMGNDLIESPTYAEMMGTWHRKPIG